MHTLYMKLALMINKWPNGEDSYFKIVFEENFILHQIYFIFSNIEAMVIY